VQGALTVNNGQALRRAALAGLGVIMQPELLLEHDLRAGRLKQVLAHAMPEPKILRMLYVSSRGHTRKLKAFIQFIREHFHA
jgi:DNA-binding transcriptional LysR family regulator